MVGVRSQATSRSMSCGIDARSCGSSARTRSTVSMMLAPGCAIDDQQHGGLAVGQAGIAHVLAPNRPPRPRRRAAPPRRCGRRRSAAGTRRRSCAWSLASICQLRCPSSTLPLGRLALVAASAARTSSRPMPYLFSAGGFSSTRTAGSAPPPTRTWPMPSTCDSFCCSTVCRRVVHLASGQVSEVSDRIRIGASAGLTLR